MDGIIPVMIIPCKKFKIPTIKIVNDDIDENGITQECHAKVKYIKDHIYKCRKCNIINNNNFELTTVLYDTIVDYIKQKEGEEFDYYYSAQKYISVDDTIANTKLLHIQGGNYHNVIMIIATISEN
jgi:hypothetical protein